MTKLHPPCAGRVCHRLITALVTGVVPTLSSSCIVVGKDYERPEFATPASYSPAGVGQLAATSIELADWWTHFEDPLLGDLVVRSLAANLDLRAALSRITEARAARGIASAELFPLVDADASFAKSQASREVAIGLFGPRTQNLFTTGLGARWEIDLWGRIRRGVEAASADIEASVEDARAVLVAVAAEVALNYIELRNLQERVRIAEANIESQASTLRLTQNRLDAGLVSELDVAQASATLESTRASLPPRFAELRVVKNRLAVLLGQMPGTLDQELDDGSALPSAPEPQSVGVPADLVRRRPDVRRAERELAAQVARIGVAEGELLPKLALVGDVGFAAEDAGSLFSRAASTFGFGPQLTAPIFQAGRLRSQIRVEDARQQQALVAYEVSVLAAIEEVESSMARYLRQQESRAALDAAVRHARRAVELSRSQYRQGLVAFQSVLDSQLRQFELEDARAVTRASISAEWIRLYTALGGGWERRDIIMAKRPEEGS